MLMDDLLQYGKGNTDLDRKIRNKCEADLIYYSVLQEIFRDYGVAGQTEMKDIHADALCIARNQMAMLASDDGLLRYDENNRVTGFYNPVTGRYDSTFTDASMEHFIRETFMNCEAVRTTVSKHLMSSPAYRNLSMTDDQVEEAVDNEFRNRILRIDQQDSPLRRVMANAASFGQTMGVDPGPDDFKFGMPEERMIFDADDAAAVLQVDRARRNATGELAPGAVRSVRPGTNELNPGDKIMVLDGLDRPRVVRNLKLSPLMPEFRILRESGMGRSLGLYRDQRDPFQQPGDNPAVNNGILMFDAQKRYLTRSPKDYNKEYLLLSRALTMSLTSGFVMGTSEFAQTQGWATSSVIYGEESYVDENGDLSLEVDESNATPTAAKATLQGTVSIDAGMRALYGWKMANIIANHSSQALTQSDYATINKIMDAGRMNGTIFGSVVRDGDGTVNDAATAYFNYIDHVCGTIRERMPAHEFGIHFEEQRYFSDKDGLVPLMYFTGERTEEYNKARANPARYFGIYPFAKYTPANLDVSPLAGDIAPAAYNTFTFTDVSHRRSGSDASMNDPGKNKFANMTRVDAGMVRSMTNLFDEYMDGPRHGIIGSGIRLTKIRRKVGDTGFNDLAEFIRPDGSVDAAAITKVLIEDMNATKAAQREDFLAPSNQMHMENIFRKFVDRNLVRASENGVEDDGSISSAMMCFVNDCDADTLGDLETKLGEEFDICLNTELREAYGQDINSFAAMKHIYRNYLKDFVGQSVTSMLGAVPPGSNQGRATRLQDLTETELTRAVTEVAYETARESVLENMTHDQDPILMRSLRELYGYGENEDASGWVDPDEPQRVVLKANMCRYSSSQFLYQDYSDLLKLLSYSDYVKYEPDMSKPAEAFFGDGRQQGSLGRNSPLAVQLYASEAYAVYDAGDYDNDSEAPDDGGYDDGDRDFASASDDRLWFDSVFADPTDGARSLAWLDADYSGEADRLDDGRPYESVPRFDHAVFEATHPLQCAALRRCGEFLTSVSRSDDRFDPNRLTISRQGMICYTDAENKPIFKIGPVIDEEGRIRPTIRDTTPDDPNGILVSRPVLNEHKFPIRDKHGQVVLEQAHVITEIGIAVDEEGKLKNEIQFGPLDRKSTMSGSDADGYVNNRFYGISARVDPYDGYDHTGKSFIDRMSLSTYQMSVMRNIELAMSVYMAAQNSDGRDGIARSLLYTNVGSTSLSKCYQTNTYLMDNKAKCAVAHNAMSGCCDASKEYEDIYPTVEGFGTAYWDVDAQEKLEAAAMNVTDLHMAQEDAYRTRIVFQKIATSQNIGLYNQAVNADLCAAQDGGTLDVKSMLDSDSKGARVAMFQPNVMLDPVISGTAKSLGAVGQLTDAVRMDRITGEIEIDPDVLEAVANGEMPNTRMPYISTGVRSFMTGDTVNLMAHSGSQAFDRQQLSGMGGMKSLNYVKEAKFCMVNLGYNMEDGYIISEDAAYAFGHFEENGKYEPLQKWDKVGDTESGNKGVVSKIVKTSIGRGLPDPSDKLDGGGTSEKAKAAQRATWFAEDEFMARYLYDYLQCEGVNHGGRGGRCSEFWDAVGVKIAGRNNQTLQPGEGHMADLKALFEGARFGVPAGKRRDDYTPLEKACAGKDVGQLRKELRECLSSKTGNTDTEKARAELLREGIYQALKSDLNAIGRDLVSENIEPFTGAYRADHACWRLFRDNPDLDVAVTNVCVCTRSNPSILMNIGEACDRDRAAMDEAKKAAEAAGEKFDKNAWLAEHGESVLKVCADMGDPSCGDVAAEPVMGACGTFSMYTDNHTAKDKNKNYNEQKKSPKDGRRVSAQENYAIQSMIEFLSVYRFMLANDPAMPDNIAKLNRKVMMNGFIFDPSDPNLTCKRLSDVIAEPDGEGGTVPGKLYPSRPESGGELMVYRSEELNNYGFVDMKAMAKVLVRQIKDNASQDEIAAASLAMSENLDFSKLLNLKSGRTQDENAKGSPKAIDDKLRHMFIVSMAREGGGFMLLPDAMTGTKLTADIGIKETVQARDDATGKLYNAKRSSSVQLSFDARIPDGDGDGEVMRTAAPLFMSSREIDNADAETVTAPVDDRAQFRTFKQVLALAVAEELHESDLIAADGNHGRVTRMSDETFEKISNSLRDQIAKSYSDMPSEKSLSLDNMNAWAKKNIYYLSMQDSMTCVWNGDPTLAIDEIGISFESAKSMGLLKPKAGLSAEDLRKIPDTYEFMADRYEPLGENDVVVVNRSPGQTKGCVRAFHPKVTGQSGGGISTNPACATIFDGDYDGDTVGVSDPLAPRALNGNTEKYKTLEAAARKELLTCMSMQGNMVHEADYTDIKYGKDCEIADVHPLFIAQNADYAVAKYNMMRPGENGAPDCGYDAAREIDSITVMANMLYQLRNCAYDHEHGASGLIAAGSAANIVSARMEQIDALSGFFENMDGEAGTQIDRKNAAAWAETAKGFDDAAALFAAESKTATGDMQLGPHSGHHIDELDEIAASRGLKPEDMAKQIETRYIDIGVEGRAPIEVKIFENVEYRSEWSMDHIRELEKTTFERFRGMYEQMAGYLSKKPLMTHGETQHEILHNIVHDANISKKGKEPQLNALLSLSSVGVIAGGRLSVGKNSDGKFELFVDGNSSGGKFDPSIRMSRDNPVSDVPKSPFRTQIESHTVAQSDKSDATGMGGAMAQKMQKVFSPMGYGGFALRTSGPITQSYLDAKQNVTKCGNNLKIGKFVLDGVSKFQKFEEFSDEAMRGANLTQVFRGQYTKCRNEKGKPVYMTVQECVQQMNNFIQVMGHPGFTKIDKAIAEAVLTRFEVEEKKRGKGKDKQTEEDKEPRKIVRDPVGTADKTHDMTYAIMYGNDNGFSGVLNMLAEEKKGPFAGSYGFDRLIAEANIGGRMRETLVGDLMASIAKNMATASHPEADGPGDPSMTREAAVDIVRSRGQSLRQALAGVSTDQSELASVLSEHKLNAGCEGAYKKIKDMQESETPVDDDSKKKPAHDSIDDILGGI